MSQFNYDDYVKRSERNKDNIGYFSLKEDGAMAIARIDLSSTQDLEFASVHNIQIGKFYRGVNCIGDVTGHTKCPFCEAAKTNSAIGKTSNRVYLKMLVRYGNADGTFGDITPVTWDRPAMLSKELANLLYIHQDLRNVLVMITRSGARGDKQTSYAITVIPENHPHLRPDLIPIDFSAFDGFDMVKRGRYLVKTAEEMDTYLATGNFPMAAKQPTQNNNYSNNYNAATPVQNPFTAPSVPTYEAQVNPQSVFINQPQIQQVANPQNPWATQITQEAPMQQPTQSAQEDKKDDDQSNTPKFGGYEFSF